MPIKQIPGKIEAESFDAQSPFPLSTQTEPTTDVGGGVDLSFIVNGTWMDYNVNVVSAGIYNVGFRVATPNGGIIQLKNSKGDILGSVTLPSTGGWNIWQTFTVPITLLTGNQTLRVFSGNFAGWHFNWMNFASTVANQVPVVNAGVDQSITLPTSNVTLTGVSSDSDGAIVSNLWSQVAGGAATIASPNALITNVVLPAVGLYSFRLTSTDNVGATAFDEVAITVNPAGTIGKTVKTVTADTTTKKVTVVYTDGSVEISDIGILFLA